MALGTARFRKLSSGVQSGPLIGVQVGLCFSRDEVWASPSLANKGTKSWRAVSVPPPSVPGRGGLGWATEGAATVIRAKSAWVEAPLPQIAERRLAGCTVAT